MKIFIRITLTLALGIIFLASTGFAGQGTRNYENEIDQMISFYEGRLHLIDIDFKILSDIGKDAKDKVTYLAASKNILVEEMRIQNIPKDSKKIRAYLSSKLRTKHIGLAYYSTP